MSHAANEDRLPRHNDRTINSTGKRWPHMVPSYYVCTYLNWSIGHESMVELEKKSMEMQHLPVIPVNNPRCRYYCKCLPKIEEPLKIIYLHGQCERIQQYNLTPYLPIAKYDNMANHGILACVPLKNLNKATGSVSKSKEKETTIEVSVPSGNRRSKRKMKNNRHSDYVYEETKKVKRSVEENNTMISHRKWRTHSETEEMDKKSTNILAKIMERRVSTKDRLLDCLDFNKPLLVVNEHNCQDFDFVNNYCKVNIVFVLDDYYQFPRILLKNKIFCDAIMKSYVMVMDSQLLYDYICGEIRPKRM